MVPMEAILAGQGADTIAATVGPSERRSNGAVRVQELIFIMLETKPGPGS
jgi:hypothetical protein